MGDFHLLASRGGLLVDGVYGDASAGFVGDGDSGGRRLGCSVLGCCV